MEIYKKYILFYLDNIYLFFVVMSLRKSKSKSTYYDFKNFTDSKGKQMESILNNLTKKYELTSKEKRDKEAEEQKEAEKEKEKEIKNKQIMKTYQKRQGMTIKKGLVSKSLKKLGNLVGFRGGRKSNKKTNNNKKTRKNKKQ